MSKIPCVRTGYFAWQVRLIQEIGFCFIRIHCTLLNWVYQFLEHHPAAVLCGWIPPPHLGKQHCLGYWRIERELKLISKSFLFGSLVVSNKQNTSVTCADQRHGVSWVRTELPEGKTFVAVSSVLADCDFLPEWVWVCPARAQSSSLAFFQQTAEVSAFRLSKAFILWPSRAFLREVKAFLEDLALIWFPGEFSHLLVSFSLSLLPAQSLFLR